MFVRSFGLKSQADWCMWSKSGPRPANVPSDPDKHYRHAGWQGMGHWLGTGTVANNNRAFLPFEEALVFVRSLGLKSTTEWCAWSKSGQRPANIPRCPDKVYRHGGWQGHGHWLGTGNRRGGHRRKTVGGPAAVAGTAQLQTQRPSRKRPATSQAMPSSKRLPVLRVQDAATQ